jgi:hypothetical protein
LAFAVQRGQRVSIGSELWFAFPFVPAGLAPRHQTFVRERALSTVESSSPRGGMQLAEDLQVADGERSRSQDCDTLAIAVLAGARRATVPLRPAREARAPLVRARGQQRHQSC